MKKRHVLLIAVFVFASSIAPASSQPPAEFPSGTYVSFISEQDIPGAELNYLVGEFAITFEDGQFVVEQDGTVIAEGTYTSTAEQIALTDVVAPSGCDPGPATYSWTFDGEQVVATNIDDACLGRDLIMTTHPLQLAIPARTYTSVLAADEVRADLGDVVGEWSIVFLDDYFVKQLDSRVVVGQYALSGNQVTLTDLAGTYSCAVITSSWAVGTYEWHYLRGELTLVPVDDPCVGRAQVFTLHPFTTGD